MDKNRFTRFEERVQALVEGSLARLFAGRLHPREIAQRLARAMEDNTEPAPDGQPIAPNHFAVHLAPEDCAALLADQPHLAAALAESLLNLAHECRFRLDTLPEVDFVPDDGVGQHTLLVRADHIRSVRQSTQVMPALEIHREAAPDAAKPMPSAFLVVDGSRYVPLDRSVINIGRRRDNTIVLDDPRVSRQHCQIRYRFGQFVLYDLGSRGGTFVNNVRITESALRPGDVISLAGVPVVYVLEDATTGSLPASGGDTEARLTLDELVRRGAAESDEDEAEFGRPDSDGPDTDEDEPL